MGLLDIFRSKKELALMQEVEQLKRRQDIKTLSEAFRSENPESAEDVIENTPYARVYETENGFQYEIIVGGVVTIHQDVAPDSEGFVPMTEYKATEMANKIVNRLRGEL